MESIKTVVMFAMLISFSACENVETVESEFSDVEAIVSEGSIKRGWVPIFIPPSSKYIKEVHNIDTNEVWMRFWMDFGELQMIEKSCRLVSFPDVTLPREPLAQWWPFSLTFSSMAKYESAEGYDYYFCGGDKYLALRASEQIAYFWRL